MYTRTNWVVVSMSLLLLAILSSCGSDNDCIISDLTVEVGECNCSDNYSLTIDFEVDNPSGEFVEVFIRNNVSIGFYKLSDLPLTIDKFEMSPNTYDFLKVCLNDDPDCCAEIEFMAPDCSDECGISELTAITGECNENGLYELELNFIYQNADNPLFDVFVRNNEIIGTYQLDQLPLVLEEFQPSGNEEDFIRVCINDNPDCCEVMEFLPPACVANSCEIFDLTVEIGDCTEDGGYALQLDFQTQNPGNDFFDLFIRNDEFIGFYSLADLPLSIDNFLPSGNDDDFIRVCINDNPDCCRAIEFAPPECESICTVSELFVEVGDCLNEETYAIWLGFEELGATTNTYEVFVRNNVSLGVFNLGDNPLMIPDFPISGNDYDFIKVCLDGNLDCCTEIEFRSPDCEAEVCEIFDVDIVVGDCTSENTYSLTLDFEVTNPGNDFYELFIRNNEPLGFFRLDSERPLEISDFQRSGADYDFLKICINDVPDCCIEVEFLPPEC